MDMASKSFTYLHGYITGCGPGCPELSQSYSIMHDHMAGEPLTLTFAATAGGVMHAGPRAHA